ncbi:MAG: hypothetical protein ACJ754_00630 [Pyrinomonadaceae bacterium]
MRIANVLLITWLAALAASVATAGGPRGRDGTHDPQPAPTSCPMVTVSCPDNISPGRPLTFSANISGGDPLVTPTFEWAVSAGTIISSGQGTSSITVDTQGTAHGVFTATVDVGGYDRSCSMSNSCTIVIEPPILPRKIDEYGDIPLGVEKQRLDNIAVELENDPTSQTCLICYGGRRGGPRAAMRRCERAKNYLISSRGIEVARVVIIDGGYREGLTVEAWIVPSGAQPPRPSPTVFPRGRDRH